MGLSFLTSLLIGAQGGQYEPQRNNNILLFITGLNAGGSEDNLTMSLKSFPIPGMSVNKTEIQHGNDRVKFSGTATFADMAVVFHDYVDVSVAQILLTWFYQVYNPLTGQRGLARDYKKSGWISLYAPDGSNERQYDLVGMWPQNFDPGQADLSGDEPVMISMNLAVDRMIPGANIAPTTATAPALNADSTGAALFG